MIQINYHLDKEVTTVNTNDESSWWYTTIT